MKILFFFLFLNFNLLFPQDIEKALIEGAEISKDKALELEKKLSENPEDLILRAKLLGYYSGLRFKDENAKKEFQKNVLWIIKNVPDSKIAGMPYTDLNKSIDGEVYNEGKKLWLENVEKFKDNVKILINAANYFAVSEKDLAEKFYKKAQEIEPENPEIYEKLGHLYALELIGKKDLKEKASIAKKSLEQYEKAFSIYDEEKKTYLLSELAEISFEAEEIEKAKKYSEELLKKAKENKKSWNYGNAIHYGNIVLGKIALREKNIAAAKKYLIKAGKTPGSPQLNSFGPDFSLAKALLDKGEKKAVLEYLKLCEKFWKMGAKKLKDWQVLIEGGRTVDFKKCP